ncbi:MAG: HD-GYP domain-containing protein, partial [Candidatus Omnitrophota bacterium]
GYAPVMDKSGQVIAVLGIDLLAKEVYAQQKELNRRAKMVLAAGILLSLLLGFGVSQRATGPIRKLEEATRHIASGDLGYRVDIRGRDEIARLGWSFNKMASELLLSRQQLQEYFYRAIEALARGLEAKDSYTRGHSDRVAGYAEATAKEMGFSLQEARMLKKAAQVHDIGKLGIDESVLNKKDKLTDEEWKIIRRHPLTGEEILRPVAADKRFLSVIRSHHERYDGSGYPDGTNGAQTDIFAQIVGVADAYDAMTSRRAYREAMSREEAVEELKKCSAAQFNPRVVEAFLKALKEF